MTAKPPLRLLTRAEAAQRLGVSTRTVSRLIAKGYLRAADVSCGDVQMRTRIREDDLNEFIEARTASPRSPSVEDALAAT